MVRIKACIGLLASGCRGLFKGLSVSSIDRNMPITSSPCFAGRHPDLLTAASRQILVELVSIIFSQMSSLPVGDGNQVTSSRLPADTASPRVPDFALRSNHFGTQLCLCGDSQIRNDARFRKLSGRRACEEFILADEVEERVRRSTSAEITKPTKELDLQQQKWSFC